MECDEIILDKKKILFNMYSLEIGGAEKSLISILNTIDYSKYEVDLFLYEKKGELIKQIPKEVNLLPEVDIYKTLCESTKLTLKNGYIRLGVIRAISKYLAKLRRIPLAYDQYMNLYANKMLPNIGQEYDVAISNIWPHNLIVDKVTAKKKIGWIHTDYSNMKIDYRMDAEVLNKLDLIIFVSDECKNTFDEIQQDLKNKSIVMENIVSSKLIENLAEEEIEENNLFNQIETKILTVSRLHHEKGVDRVVDVCMKLKEDRIKFKWYIVGFGSEEEEIKLKIKELGLENHMYILGKKVNPYPYFKNCDIYVQPSRFEGKAIAITEAKIFNKPIIITNYKSARDQIRDRRTGLIVENSVDGIYKGVKEILTDSDMRQDIIKNLRKVDWSNEDEIDNLYRILG